MNTTTPTQPITSEQPRSAISGQPERFAAVQTPVAPAHVIAQAPRPAPAPQTASLSLPNRIAVQAADPKGQRGLAFTRGHALPVQSAKADDALPPDITWMPAGRHEICACMLGGDSWLGTVICDELGAQNVIRDFNEMQRQGQRLWLDKLHDDGEATAWVTAFRWDAARGIVAEIEWTPLGAQILREKRLYSFSPSFWVDRDTGRVAGLLFGHAAGGLVNAPAFGAAMPALIAARMAGATPPTTNAGDPGNSTSDTVMNKELLLKLLAALGVTPPADANETALTALVAQNIDKVANRDQLSAVTAQLNEARAKVQTPEQAAAFNDLKKTVEALQAARTQALKETAAAAVQAAVDRGALKKDDKTSIEFWTKLCENDQSAMVQLNAMQGEKKPAAEPIIVGDITQLQAARGANGQAQNGNVIQITEMALVDALKAYAAAPGRTPEDRQKRAGIYARNVGPLLARAAGDMRFALMPILASNSLGTLAGDLVVQRSLTLLKFAFPALTAWSTDFSDQAVKYNQQIVSRIRTVPASANYVPGTGYATQNAVTTDVPVTIDGHKGIPISFNANELASTDRDLFGEQVEGAHQRIGLDLTGALLALITTANFANETVSTLGAFNRAKVASLAGDLYARGVSPMNRALMLNNDFFGQLQSDSSIVSYAAFQRPELITEFMLPKVAGMQPYHTINMPTTDNLVGFGGTPDALLLATRVPNDWTQALPGAGNGNVSVVTNPDTGISVQLVQYVDNHLAAAFWRVAYMFGVAVGQVASGQRLVSEATSS